MAYQSNIPQAADNISKSQGDILANFQFLGSASGSFSNGFYKLPNGVIMQWGEATGIVSGLNAISLPTTFPNNVWNIQLTEVKNSTSSTNIMHVSVEPTGPNIVSFNMIAQGGATPNFPTKVYFFAIGN